MQEDKQRSLRDKTFLQQTPLNVREEQITDEINNYSIQRKLSISFDKSNAILSTGSLSIEPELEKISKETPQRTDHPLTPDLLYHSKSGKVVIDLKVVKSGNYQTCEERALELLKYRRTLGYLETRFVPELVALVPKPAVDRCVSTETVAVVGYEIEDGNVILGPMKNSIKNLEFCSLFDEGFLIIPVYNGTVQFLRKPPPLAYTSDVIYRAIQAACPVDYYNPSSRMVEKEALKYHIKSAYPKYLLDKAGNPIQQIAEGRLNTALEFLDRNKWIKLLRSERIEYLATKGSKTGNILKTFISTQAREDFVAVERKIDAERRHQESVRDYSSIPDFAATK